MHDLLARGNGLPAVCYKIKLKEKKQMKRHLKTAAAGILMFGALGATAQVQALPLLIDDFTMSQDVIDKGGDTLATRSTVAPLTGTDLVNATRTVSALATGTSLESEQAIIGESFLSINNTIGSDGTASINYKFNTTDFTANGMAFLLKVIAIDLGVQVKLSINNGLARSGFQTFTGAGDFYRPYTTFSGDTSQFTHVNNLRLKFKGVPAWDGRFQLLISDVPPNTPDVPPSNAVPEPAVMSLIGLGLASLGFRKKKQG